MSGSVCAALLRSEAETMTRQIKSLPRAIKSMDGSTVTGICSVMGNLDDYSDRMWPGSFQKTIQERGDRILHLWQHDFSSPPIAVIKSIREVARAELPPVVIQRAPEASGGVEVVREYLNTPRAQEVLESLRAGAPLEMSFAYDAVKYDFEEKPDAKYEWDRIRNLREIRLYETSDVLWGANDATVASKSLLLPFDFVLRQLVERLTEMQDEAKAGQRNSTEDLARINSIAKLAIDLGATNVKLLDEQLQEIDPTDDGKSRAAAAAALTQTPDLYKYKLAAAERMLALHNRSV
jgi:HK97 family phage prohead protease